MPTPTHFENIPIPTFNYKARSWGSYTKNMPKKLFGDSEDINWDILLPKKNFRVDWSKIEQFRNYHSVHPFANDGELFMGITTKNGGGAWSTRRLIYIGKNNRGADLYYFFIKKEEWFCQFSWLPICEKEYYAISFNDVTDIDEVVSDQVFAIGEDIH